MDEKVQTICDFDESKLAELAAKDEWWSNAYNWYKDIKDTPFSQVPEVQKGWISQMKVRYAQETK